MFYITMLFDLLTNILFPRICLSCRRTILTGAICDECLEKIDLRKDGLNQNATALYASGAATDYSNATVQSLIHHLKFRSISDAAETLGNLMVQWAKNTRLDLDACCYVMPIPLSRQRRRARGYNQAELIARHFAATLDLPLETHALVRTRHTKPQSETTSISERMHNIHGVFAVRNPDAVRGKNILLIDDVYTSGTTFLEAASVLHEAGAARIIALAAAKA